jgi:hypothetical protein
MRSVRVLAALVALGFTAPTALAQSSTPQSPTPQSPTPGPPMSGNARWGMTVGEALETFSGEAVRVKTRRGRGRTFALTRKVEIDGRDYRAAFWFDGEDGRLMGFNVRPVDGSDLREGDYQQAKQLLVQEYGPPAREVSNPAVGSGYRRAEWFLPHASVSIWFFAGARVPLQVNYAPPRPLPSRSPGGRGAWGSPCGSPES